MEEKLLKLIRLDDFDEETRALAELLGSVEQALLLHEHYGGTRHYFRQLDSILLPAIYRRIREAYHKEGWSIKKIIEETGYTEVWIRKILFGDGDTRQGLLFEDVMTK